MIIVTGGAGFIGSALVWRLNQLGYRDILIVDRLGVQNKWKNLAKLEFSWVLHKDQLGSWLQTEGKGQAVEAVFHMGASSSTTETDVDYLMSNNLKYSMDLYDFCAERAIPYIYASSAATYGDGSRGFDDQAHDNRYHPLNPYGFSKQTFDQWVLRQTYGPSFWAGLKFFNVYGPNEYHKGGQSSVVFQFLPQARDTGKIRLFKSYKEGVAHGEQARDFVYVKDVVGAMIHLWRKHTEVPSGIYNIGSGKARSYIDLARAVFSALGKDAQIEFCEMPQQLVGQYQYFTEAKMTKLREIAGYSQPFYTLEDGVRDYVCSYLLQEDPYL